MTRPEHGRVFLSLLLGVLLTGCATGPGLLDAQDIRTDLDPATAASAGVTGARVVWAGRIIDNRSLRDGSVLEVLGYPLDGVERPRTGETALGRFVVTSDDFLEPADFAPGRLITVRGSIVDTLEGHVGEAPYRFPELEPEALHLWPADTERAAGEPRVRFGVGVMISR